MNKDLTALEALNNIKNLFIGSSINPTQQFEIIETALKENEKLKKLYKVELKNTAYYNNLALKYRKALEIIKKKKVNVWTLLETKTCAEYNFKEVIVKTKRKLIEEEYDLLKEVLK